MYSLRSVTVIVISLQLPVLAESLAIDALSVPELFASQGQTTLPGMTKESWYKVTGWYKEDLLLPCGFLPVEETPEQGPQLSKARKMDLRSNKVRNQQAECDESGGELTDEEDFDFDPQHSLTSKHLSPDHVNQTCRSTLCSIKGSVVVDIPECDTLEEEGSGNNSLVHKEGETVLLSNSMALSLKDL